VRAERREGAHNLALVFGLVHLLANIPIWLGRKGLEGIEEVSYTISVCCLSYKFSTSTACSLTVVYSCQSIPTALYTFPRPDQGISQISRNSLKHISNHVMGLPKIG
jgi:hypothetical protein